MIFAARTCRGCGCDGELIARDARAAGQPARIAQRWVLLDFAIDVDDRGRLFVEPLPTGVCSACAAAICWDARHLACMALADAGHEDAAA